MPDAESFSAAFQAYQKRVHSYLWRRMTNKSIVDDLVSETFLKAWIAWPTYVEDGKLERWLICIAYRVLVDYTRAAETRYAAAASDAVLARAESASSEADLSAYEDDEWVACQLARITPQQRSVIELADAGYANEEIADLTGIRYGAVKALKMRGLHSLRRLMVAA